MDILPGKEQRNWIKGNQTLSLIMLSFTVIGTMAWFIIQQSKEMKEHLERDIANQEVIIQYWRALQEQSNQLNRISEKLSRRLNDTTTTAYAR